MEPWQPRWGELELSVRLRCRFHHDWQPPLSRRRKNVASRAPHGHGSRRKNRSSVAGPASRPKQPGDGASDYSLSRRDAPRAVRFGMTSAAGPVQSSRLAPRTLSAAFQHPPHLTSPPDVPPGPHIRCTPRRRTAQPQCARPAPRAQHSGARCSRLHSAHTPPSSRRAHRAGLMPTHIARQ